MKIILKKGDIKIITEKVNLAQTGKNPNKQKLYKRS